MTDGIRNVETDRFEATSVDNDGWIIGDDENGLVIFEGEREEFIQLLRDVGILRIQDEITDAEQLKHDMKNIADDIERVLND